jgi:hypothetical protein
MRRYRCPAKRRRPCPTSDVVARRARDEPPAPVSEKGGASGSRLLFVRSGNAASVRVGARALRNAEVSGAGLLARWRLAPPGRGVRLATHGRCPFA